MKKSYTSDDYKNLINRFCIENNYSKSQTSRMLREDIYSMDLFHLETDDIIKIIVDKMCANSRNPQYLIESRMYLNLFYAWAKKNHFTPVNPFEASRLLSYKVMLQHLCHKVDLTVFDDDFIEDICATLRTKPNWQLYELLVRGFYEGIKSAPQFSMIIHSDIDFTNNCVKIDGEWKSFSEEFMNVLERYKECDEFITPLGKVYPTIQVDDVLFKRTVKNEIYRVSREQHIKNTSTYIGSKYFKYISNEIELNITGEMLYKSGFIEFVRKKMQNKTDDEFVDLFINNNKKNMSQLTLSAYGKEYGLSKNGYNIRKDYYIYIVKSKYYH